MTTAADVVNQARGWVGTAEEPPKSNQVPGITDWFGAVGPWCDMFISRILSDAGIPHKCAWVPTEVVDAGNGVDGFSLVDISAIAAGDLLLYDFPDGVAFDHIGIAESRDGDEVITIEGNWGDAVTRVIRHIGVDPIAAVVRPPYAAPAPRMAGPSGLRRGGPHVFTAVIDMPILRRRSTGRAVRELQAALGFTGADVDGDFQGDTADAVIAFQRAHGLNDDGEVGTVTWTALLQALLIPQGYQLTVTGRMDAGTAESVGDWQLRAGLTTDYSAGINTFGSLTGQ